jgi:hypothetical protein
MIKTIPATREHLIGAFTGFNKTTVKAVAIVDGDEVLCVGGTYRTNEGIVAFMKADEKMRKYPKHLFATAKRFLSNKGIVYAVCDLSISGADRFLEHLGFENIEGDLWRGHL